WPPITGGRVDTLREQWLTDPRFTSVEVMVASDAAALIATKR
ncbi:MAG: cytidine deaminase, partial [Nocardioides sp.]|nr:cytidine deaminase [Nocardioides sp.]